MRPSSPAALGRRQPGAAADWVSSLGLPAATIVLFGVSGGLLWLIGYNYDGLTGNPVTKIHPFTYMVAALFAWKVMASGDPVGAAARVAERRPAALLMALAGMLLLVVTVLRKGPGMAGFVDTFVGPALMVFLLADAGDRALGRIAFVLHGLMGLNALMALGEFATRTLVFPYRFDGAVFPTDLRSTALQGHPLVNASITACYVLALMSGARSLPNAVRLLMIALQCAALVTFGGRSGMVITLLFGGGYIVLVGLGALRRGRVPLLGAAIGILLLTLVPVAVGALSTAGFFDALLARFSSDGGSANARVEMLSLFQAIPLRDIIVGPDIGYVESLRRVNGLQWGIENPIVRLTLYQGAFLTAIAMIAFVLFMVELARGRERSIWLPMIGCLILINTAESIGAKTTLLAKFAVITTCLYRREPERPVAVPISRTAWSTPAPR